MTYDYKTKGVCARKISVELEGDIIRRVNFHGGCAGNLAGISKLVEGMRAGEVIEKFRGTRCGAKRSSCPDQLSQALAEALGINEK